MHFVGRWRVRLRSSVCLSAPSKLAARIESSKAFAKKFMKRFDIACAQSESFDDFQKASAFIKNAPWPFVLKASGLAAGKGVVMTTSHLHAQNALREMMLNRSFGDAGEEVVVEERLEGHEISVMALCDGERARLLPICKDHKRLLDDDVGVNTGGMGALAPIEVSESERHFIENNIIKRALYGMQKSFTPFKGVLFAGVMLTKSGPKVLEFNCRFGDPETQALLPERVSTQKHSPTNDQRLRRSQRCARFSLGEQPQRRRILQRRRPRVERECASEKPFRSGRSCLREPRQDFV